MTQCSSPETVMQAFWAGLRGREDCAISQGALNLPTTGQCRTRHRSPTEPSISSGIYLVRSSHFSQLPKRPCYMEVNPSGICYHFNCHTPLVFCLPGGRQTSCKVIHSRRLKTVTEKQMLLSRSCWTQLGQHCPLSQSILPVFLSKSSHFGP